MTRFCDIIEHKQTVGKQEAMHKELIETSRRAAMAEIAGGILHNVANVLNSVNISAEIVSQKVRHSRLSGLVKAVALMNEHSGDLARFFTVDEKGSQLPSYLQQVVQAMAREQDELLVELKSLSGNLEHIKSIIDMQQTYSRGPSLVETFPIGQPVDDALRIAAPLLDRHGIQLVTDYQCVPQVTADRQKVLQILVNLIQNAKQALQECQGPPRTLTVRVGKTDGDRLEVQVIDNGEGIPPDNLLRIFTYGFTSRKDGHGLGLHNSALLAKQLGGTLSAHSDGVGKGAAFTLVLPIQPCGAALPTVSPHTKPCPKYPRL